MPILAVLGAGLLVRLILAFAVFRGQGFAGDLAFFGRWAQELAAGGPGAFYAGDPSANYPPGYMSVLWALGGISALAGAHGVPTALLKVPAIVADLGVALLLFRAAGTWFGVRAGVFAAALYLLIPVTWYDSALWGQVDAVAALAMMAALVLLIEGWSEPAAVMAVVGVLIKPQALVTVVILAPVLIRRHVFAVGSGPVPVLGPRLARLDAIVGGPLTRQGPSRLITSALAAGAATIVVVAPFDIERFTSASLAAVPIVGDIAGIVGLMRSAASQYSVLTANAYNAWALVGPHPLVLGIGAPGWTADSLPVFGGIPAVAVVASLFFLVCLIVAGGLFVRDGRLAIVLGFTLVAFAFYATPARVHERYLFAAFASGAILASGGLARAAGFVGVGLLNTLNLHAVLAAPSGIGVAQGGPPGPRPQRGGGGLSAGIRIDTLAQLHLPLADLATSPAVATGVALGQTAAMVALLIAWLVVIAKAAATSPGARAGPTAALAAGPRRPLSNPAVRIAPEIQAGSAGRA